MSRYPNPHLACAKALLVAAAVLVSSSCHRESAARGVAHDEPPAAARAAQVVFQVAKSDPCAWLDRPAAERAIGTPLASDPVRVFAVDNRNPSPEGEACLYRVSGAQAG